MTQLTVEKKTLSNFINGQWVKSTTDKYEQVPNPATGEVLAEVPVSTEEDLNQAVAAAKEAFKTWRKVPVPQRLVFYSNTINCLWKTGKLLLN